MSNSEEPLQFSLSIRTRPLQLDIPGEGVVDCELRELTGKQRDAYMNVIGKRAKIGPDKKPTGMLSDFEGIESGLVADSLRRVEPIIVDDKPVNTFEQSFIQSWPSSVITKLADLVREMSGLDDEGDEGDEEGEG